MAPERLELIRNFCIIAHIDHGKSTLADRILEKTGVYQQREMVDQIMDSMELERGGDHHQSKAVSMRYTARDGRSTPSTSSTPPGMWTSPMR